MAAVRRRLPQGISESRVTEGPVSISAQEVYGVPEAISMPELLLIKPRAGKGILSESLERVASTLNPKAKEMLDEWERKTKPKGDTDQGGERAVKWVESFDRRREILDTLHTHHGRRLTYMEATALMAIRHGLDGEKLLLYIQDMAYMHQRGIVDMGGIVGMQTIFKVDLPRRVERALEETPHAMSGDEIGRNIGLDMDVPQSKRNRLLYELNTSLNLLDMLNKVVKLPKAASLTVWIHPKYRYSEATVPEWSLKYKVLKTMYARGDEPMTRGEISVSDEVRKVVESKENPQQMAGKLRHALDDLRRFGLLKTHEGTTDPSHPNVTFYSLSDEAKEWMKTTLDEGRIHEDLRKTLLGEHYEGLSERQLDMLERIEEWIRVRRELEKDPQRGETEVASALGEKLGYIKKVKTGDTPWGEGMAKTETLEEYLPHISDPEDARWFGEFIQKPPETNPHQTRMLQRIRMWVEMKKAVGENPGRGSVALATILNNKPSEEFTDPNLAPVTWTERPLRRMIENEAVPWVTENLDEITRTYGPLLNETQRPLFERYVNEIKEKKEREGG